MKYHNKWRLVPEIGDSDIYKSWDIWFHKTDLYIFYLGDLWYQGDIGDIVIGDISKHLNDFNRKAVSLGENFIGVVRNIRLRYEDKLTILATKLQTLHTDIDLIALFYYYYYDVLFFLGNSTACKNARTCNGQPLSKTCLSTTYTKFNA